MYRPGGSGIIVDPDIGTTEFDTITCWHCNCLVRVEPRTPPERQTRHLVIQPERCRMCMHHICPVCVAEAQRAVRACAPFERRLDEYERGRRGVLR